jgi:hypothetical protein
MEWMIKRIAGTQNNDALWRDSSNNRQRASGIGHQRRHQGKGQIRAQLRIPP